MTQKPMATSNDKVKDNTPNMDIASEGDVTGMIYLWRCEEGGRYHLSNRRRGRHLHAGSTDAFER